MSNLSDLLPAGASAKQITATDSGSGIASKKPVIMNASGTVTQVLGSTVVTSAGAESTFDSAAISSFVEATYDTANNKVVMIWRTSAAGDYGYAAVGTVSGTNISWGTRVAFNSGVTSMGRIDFDTNAGKVLIIFNSSITGSNIGYGIVGTVSGTSISFGTKVALHTREYNDAAIVYDSSANASLIVYADPGNSAYPTGKVATISGTSVSFGSAAVIASYGLQSVSLAYSTAASKSAVNMRDVHHGDQRAVVATISGTSVSFGAYTQASSNYYHRNTAAYDVNADRVVFAGTTQGASYYGRCVVGTISGTSISFGTEVTFTTSTLAYQKAVYDSLAKTINICYAIDAVSRLGEMVVGTVSDTTIAFALPFQFHPNPTKELGAAFDSDTNQTIVGYLGTSDYGEAKALVTGRAATNLTAQAFVGVADSAISASAAGSIIVQGGTVTGPTADVTVSQSLSSAFLFGQDAPADPVNSKAAAAGGNNFLIAYEVNDGATKGARVQAATVTTGNLSYGSSAVIGASTAFVYNYSISYDSTNDKFVVFWRNQTDGYIYAAVVTLTGNSVSYGATSAVYSAVNVNRAGSFSSTYDPDTDRVILGVCDDSDNYAYSVVIELGTTTIDTVGTPQKIDSASATAGYGKSIALCYDTTENKVIATYVYVGGGGSYYLRVAAGTVAGGVSNSTTWGSSSVVYSGDADRAAIAYNATDQRVVVAYKQASDSKGYSSVATVSGTTVTANTPSIFFDAASGTLSIFGLAHDAYVNEMAIYARASQGDAFSGSIDTAANTIVWNAKFDVDANAYNPPQIAFNSNTNQTIISGGAGYKSQSNSYIWTVPGTVTGQPLTTGTKYFVTPSGGFSSTAGDPSVNAGLAISTTSLLLNGDS